MKEWFSIPELAEEKLPDLPGSTYGIRLLAEREGWNLREQLWRHGQNGAREYHISLLPDPARYHLEFKYSQLPSPEEDAALRSKLLWKRFDALTEAQRDTCRSRLTVLVDVETMRKAGVSGRRVIAEIKRIHGVSKDAWYRWQAKVSGVPRADWLPALADARQTIADGIVTEKAECHPDAWKWLCSDYLRPGEPKFSSCFRRMKEVAKLNGWSPIPSERTLRRRLNEEYTAGQQVLARQGREAARRMLPTQRRDKSTLHAMSAVNTDGHVLDLRISAPWSKEPVRIVLLAIQDIYSGKILSWRLCQSERWEAVRAVVGDMVEAHGIPDIIFMDNGKAFASKQISGQSDFRHRFKRQEDEVTGLLVALGIAPRFTKVRRGQSKPIERAWKDLAQEIALHPLMNGAYTGANPLAKPCNYGTRAAPLDEVRMVVADRVAEHNARIGRRSRIAAGRSFDETFAESYAANAHRIRMPTGEQRTLWLMAADQRVARKPNGHIEYQKNRYWAPELQGLIGKKLDFRFDPDRLHEPLKVYDSEGRLICDAKCIEDSGFTSMEEARIWAKSEAEYLAAERAYLNSRQLLSPRDLGRMALSASPAKPAPTRPVVQRMATTSAARKVEVEEQTGAMSKDEFYERLSANMRGLGPNVVKFPPQGGKP